MVQLAGRDRTRGQGVELLENPAGGRERGPDRDGQRDQDRFRGITLSVSQVHRLVTGTPERLSLPVLAALCDIFDIGPGDLIATRAQNVEIRKTGTGAGPGVVDLAALRPKRARIRPE
ncbi:helix-turn-helix domain-containing protein [Actinoallomurus sp. CA-150999]|uniref:helix-turn-helix domain-containing protein n=1 Tax=Actinoallomurus sp. CA-150999 TaxID=3239887 RepID=UPI003D91C567